MEDEELYGGYSSLQEQRRANRLESRDLRKAFKDTFGVSQRRAMNLGITNQLTSDKAANRKLAGTNFGSIARKGLSVLGGVGAAIGAVDGALSAIVPSQNTLSNDPVSTMANSTGIGRTALALFGKETIPSKATAGFGYTDSSGAKTFFESKANEANEEAKKSWEAYALANSSANRRTGATNNSWINSLQGNTGITLSKNGSKLITKNEARELLNQIREVPETSAINFLQNGGSILVPDGALHARKHHMEEVNPEVAEDLTKKGIPVVVTDEDGKPEQCAEIEKEELIFEKSLTDKVEGLWKKGDEDSMVECGKLIVKTLFTNCDDNSGLIDSIE